MPNTKLTKTRWQNHLQYGKRTYIVLILVGLMAADLLFSITEYRPPNHRKVEVQIVAAYANTDNAAEYSAIAMEKAQAYELARDQAAGIDTTAEDYEIPLQEVGIYNIAYSGDDSSENDYYGAQKYMVMLAAQEGHIYIVPRNLLEGIVESGIAYPLDEFIASGLLHIEGVDDFSSVTYDEYVDEGMPATGNTCIYALPIDTLTGMESAFTLPVENMYMVMMGYVQNPDTVAVVMQSLIDQFWEEPVEEETTGTETAEPEATIEPEQTAEPAQTTEKPEE